MCTDLVASGWFFQYNYLYTVMITIYLGGGELGMLGEELLPLKYPKLNLGVSADQCHLTVLQAQVYNSRSEISLK